MFNNNHYYCSWIPYEFLRILSIFRGNICLSHAIVAVDINMETWKGILLSEFTQNVVEACFLRNITAWDYLLRNWCKMKFPENWPYFLCDCLPINNIYRPKKRIMFWSALQDHGRFEVNLFLIFFIKGAKLQESLINASTLPK